MCLRNVTNSAVDDTNRLVPYTRNLAGEVMFADTGEVAGWLAGTAYPAAPQQVRTWARNQAANLKPAPAPACWVVSAEHVMLIPPGTVRRFTAQARENGLGVRRLQGPGTLLLTGGDGTRDTHVITFEGEPPLKAQPRWWLSQQQAWLDWNETGRRHGAGNPQFTEGNQERDKQWGPILPEQRAKVAELVKESRRAGGRKVTVAQVTAVTGLGPYRARNLLRELGVRHLTDEELNVAVRDMVPDRTLPYNSRGDKPVVPVADVMALGVSRERAAAAIEAAGAVTRAPRQTPDLELLKPDSNGLVRATAVARAYGLDPSAVSRRVERGDLTRVGSQEAVRGRPLMLRLKQVREVLG